jgi:hypothetical protein
LNSDFEIQQHLGSLKHVINIIIWIRDTGCYSDENLCLSVRGSGGGLSCTRGDLLLGMVGKTVVVRGDGGGRW